MLTFKFTGANGIMTVQELLTSGMVGKQVRFEFTSDWDDLQKTAVFVAGDVSRAVVNVGTEAVIPAEVLQAPNQRLFVGIFGVNAEGTLIIPTIMAKGPKIHKGAEPSDDPSTDPDPAVWQQMLSAIGDLNDLTTEAKSSLVAAINELAKGGSGGSSGNANSLTLTSPDGRLWNITISNDGVLSPEKVYQDDVTVTDGVMTISELANDPVQTDNVLYIS